MGGFLGLPVRSSAEGLKQCNEESPRRRRLQTPVSETPGNRRRHFRQASPRRDLLQRLHAAFVRGPRARASMYLILQIFFRILLSSSSSSFQLPTIFSTEFLAFSEPIFSILFLVSMFIEHYRNFSNSGLVWL